MASVQTAPAVQQPGSAIPNHSQGINIKDALQVPIPNISRSILIHFEYMLTEAEIQADEGIRRVRQGSRISKGPPDTHEPATTTHIPTTTGCLCSTTAAAADVKPTKCYVLGS